MQVVLISTYDLGHQPFGLASPASWLKNAGATVTCVDLAVQSFAEAVAAIATADLIAFFLPMHTATKLATVAIPRAMRLNPNAHLCAYGLYAAINANYLQELGIDTILGGEFEQELVVLCESLRAGKRPKLPLISLARQQFQPPDRSGLPPLTAYAHLQVGEEDPRVVGYTLASRGCQHRCRHCPIVPVYDGRFRIIQQDIVLADIRQQVAAGAHHITFGDPDFFNGPGHALPLVKALHEEFPELTYDVTIKVEHLQQYGHHLSILKESGCLFVTSAVETVDNHILDLFAKGHTRADFEEVVALCRKVGLTLNPTFVTFTPWTTARGFAELLATIANLGLIDHVAPIQYAIRLLIPAESRLLDLQETNAHIQAFDADALVFPWRHPDSRMDDLYETVIELVKANSRSGESRQMHFERIWQAAIALLEPEEYPERSGHYEEVVVPTLSEDWY